MTLNEFYEKFDYSRVEPQGFIFILSGEINDDLWEIGRKIIAECKRRGLIINGRVYTISGCRETNLFCASHK